MDPSGTHSPPDDRKDPPTSPSQRAATVESSSSATAASGAAQTKVDDAAVGVNASLAVNEGEQSSMSPCVTPGSKVRQEKMRAKQAKTTNSKEGQQTPYEKREESSALSSPVTSFETTSNSSTRNDARAKETTTTPLALRLMAKQGAENEEKSQALEPPNGLCRTNTHGRRI